MRILDIYLIDYSCLVSSTMDNVLPKRLLRNFDSSRRHFICPPRLYVSGWYDPV